MGLMTGIMGFLFGNSRNVLVETAQVFVPNAENSALRDADAKAASVGQFAAEFAHARHGLFDRAVDALNRLPRPMLALGTIWLFVMAMRDPASFADGMIGLALVPEPLWWLMGAIVSFYFGARHQAKEQEFQRSVALAVATLPKPAAAPGPQAAAAAPDPVPDGARFDDNAALADWQRSHGK